MAWGQGGKYITAMVLGMRMKLVLLFTRNSQRWIGLGLKCSEKRGYVPQNCSFL